MWKLITFIAVCAFFFYGGGEGLRQVFSLVGSQHKGNNGYIVAISILLEKPLIVSY